MPVYLALDLILTQTAGFGQLTHDDERLAAAGDLAHVGGETDLLTYGELMGWHSSCGFNVLGISGRPFFFDTRLPGSERIVCNRAKETRSGFGKLGRRDASGHACTDGRAPGIAIRVRLRSAAKVIAWPTLSQD